MNGKKIIFSLILSVVCFLLYSNSLFNSFVSDDIPAILQNYQIGNFAKFWLDAGSLLNSLVFLVAGFNTFYYHLVNILLHILSTVLLFYFLCLFFKTIPAFLGTCLFAVHPIHTEAVTWISGKSYLIMFVVFLVAYFLYLKAMDNQPTANLFYFSLCIVSAAYCTIIIPWGVLFPLFIILSDISFKRWRKSLAYTAFLLLIVVSVFVLTKKSIFAHRISYMVDDVGYHISQNPFVYSVYSLYYHLWLLLWPLKLTLFHEPIIIPESMFRFSLLYLLPWIALLWYSYKKEKIIFFAVGIFILFLSPTFSPIPIASLIAERYLYFPSISLSIIISFAYQKYALRADRFSKYSALVIIALICINYILRTIERNKEWHTPESFWQSAVNVSPMNFQALTNLGYIYLREGKAGRAIEYLERAVALVPKSVDTYNNLAVAYYNERRFEDADKCFYKILKINPRHTNAYLGLGKIKSELGKREEAIVYFKRAIEIDPQLAPAYLSLCKEYTGNESEIALAHCQEALKLGHSVSDNSR